MRVDIARTLDSATNRVLFTSDVGTAVGIWDGTEPAKLGPAHVEFDVPDEITDWTVLVEPSPGAIEGGIEVKSGVRIVATDVQVGEDGDPVVSVRITTDIVMIEMSERRSELTNGSTIRFTAPEIHLSSYEL